MSHDAWMPRSTAHILFTIYSFPRDRPHKCALMIPRKVVESWTRQNKPSDLIYIFLVFTFALKTERFPRL